MTLCYLKIERYMTFVFWCLKCITCYNLKIWSVPWSGFWSQETNSSGGRNFFLSNITYVTGIRTLYPEFLLQHETFFMWDILFFVLPVRGNTEINLLVKRGILPEQEVFFCDSNFPPATIATYCSFSVFVLGHTK